MGWTVPFFVLLCRRNPQPNPNWSSFLTLMKSKSTTLTRLLRLHRAVRRDREPRTNLSSMSKRFVFIAAQEHRSLTGSLVNVDVFARLMSIARATAICGIFAALVACGIAARLSIDAALRAALVLLICGTVVWYRVMANISTVLNFDKCVEFMDLLDQAAALLNQPGQDALWWLRRSANDLSALAASAVSNALDTKQLDEAKRQIELFVTLGLVTGQTLNKFKQQLAAALQAAQSAPVSA